MHPLLSLCVFWLLPPVALMLKENSPLDYIPRRSVSYNSNNALLFREEGVLNYSTMLLREDLDLLMVGAREAMFALDLRNISKKISSVMWKVSDAQVEECEKKGKDAERECKNYIRILHKMKGGKMYVCGTNAFDPACDQMSYADGHLAFLNMKEDGKGKCPFDPFQRYASFMIGDDLYSATSINFLGSEPVLMRSSLSMQTEVSNVPIRTEIKNSWLHDPNFVSMAWIQEGVQSKNEDDDKVYLFFSETAVEFDFYSKLGVSRVARVCKGDLGGQRTLQKRWTSFLKARLDCRVPGSKLPYIIQDSYRWCDPSQHWEKCIFYATFVSQSLTSEISAVCAYRMSDISKVFSEGKYKTQAPVETSYVKWVTYSGEVPEPRPGACINAEARRMHINKTLDLPDKTLQFIRDKPLMDQAIEPIGGHALLSRTGAKFTRSVVNQVEALDGEKYMVLFIGTDQGTLLKALIESNDEVFVIEEVELFSPPQPIKILKFSSVTGHIYAGSDSSAVQIPPANCERSSTCIDCVLARDPYCGWDAVERKCVSISSPNGELIQDMKGEASRCPAAEPVVPSPRSIRGGVEEKLKCTAPSNLAKLVWKRTGVVLPHSAQDGSLVIIGSADNEGDYSCLSVERSKMGEYATTVAVYRVRVDAGNSSITQSQIDCPSRVGLLVLIILLAVLVLLLLAWNTYKNRLPCLSKKNDSKKDVRQVKVPFVDKKPNNNHNSSGGDLCVVDGTRLNLTVPEESAI